MSLSHSEVGEILQLVQSMDCDEVLLEIGDIRIHVRKGGAAGPPGPATPVAGTLASGSSEPQAAETSEGSPQDARAGATADHEPRPTQDSGTSPAAGPEADNWLAVPAPMVGTFYRSPAPGDPPFVEVGSTVTSGQTLGIIEVMKLMNHIQAETGGRIVRIDAENEQLVEYGQPLMWIEPE